MSTGMTLWTKWTLNGSDLTYSRRNATKPRGSSRSTSSTPSKSDFSM